MDKNVKGIIGLVVVAGVGYVGFLQASWGLYCMKVGERLKNLDRFVTADQILALPGQFKEDAAHYHVVGAEGMTSDMMIEARTVQGDMLFYFLVVTTHVGTKSSKDEARIESQQQLLESSTRERLKEKGVTFKGCG